MYDRLFTVNSEFVIYHIRSLYSDHTQKFMINCEEKTHISLTPADSSYARATGGTQPNPRASLADIVSTLRRRLTLHRPSNLGSCEHAVHCLRAKPIGGEHFGGDWAYERLLVEGFFAPVKWETAHWWKLTSFNRPFQRTSTEHKQKWPLSRKPLLVFFCAHTDIRLPVNIAKFRKEKKDTELCDVTLVQDSNTKKNVTIYFTT